LRNCAVSKKEVAQYIVRFHEIISIRHLQILLIVLWSFGCGIIPRSHNTVLPSVPASATSQSSGSTVEIRRTPGKFMLADSSPVYEHPDKASAIIAYVPQGAHEKVAAGTGDWLLIRLPHGKVGFIPLDSVEQEKAAIVTGPSE